MSQWVLIISLKRSSGNVISNLVTHGPIGGAIFGGMIAVAVAIVVGDWGEFRPESNAFASVGLGGCCLISSSFVSSNKLSLILYIEIKR